MNKLKGKKTYLLAFATVCYAIGGVVSGYVSWEEAFNIFQTSGLAATIRAGVASIQQP